MKTRAHFDDEEKPFLDDASDVSTIFDDGKTAGRSTSRLHHIITVALAITVVISLAANIWQLQRSKQLNEGHKQVANGLQIPYSPVDPFVTYELKSIDTHDDSDPFIGPPGDEFDQAWSHLLAPTSIRLTTEEMLKANKQSLKLREDEGYLGYLEMYHQLHCVKRMVQLRWPERYPELVEKGQLTDTHFNHCIQVLRKGIMCNGDTSLDTFTWDPANITNIKGLSDHPRKCVNWDQVDGWARSRALGPHYKVLQADEEGFLGPDLR